MELTSSKGTPDQKLAHQARVWRALEKISEADKSSRDKQRAEYRARRAISKTVDDEKAH